MLSGEDRTVPEPLRAVASALDALRAPPTRGELLGEAEARAYFRKTMLGGQGEPARPGADAGEARTLILPAGEAGRAARHRHRRPRPRGRWQAKALAGAAAIAVAAVGAAALAGTFSSSGGRPAAAGDSHQPSGSAAPVTAAGGNGVDGTAKPEPSVKPTPETKAPKQPENAPSPGELCREFSGFLTHPGRHASLATERKVFQQLSSLAGGAGRIEYYCMRVPQPWAAPQGPGKSSETSRYPFPNGLPGLQGLQNDQGSQGSQGTGSVPGQGGDQGGGTTKGGNSQGGNSQGGNSQGGNSQGGNGSGSGPKTVGKPG